MTQKPEVTLDPQDWEAFRQLGHQMLDDMVDHLQSLRDQPIWQEIPDAVQEAFQQPLPEDTTSQTEVYESFKDNILPYPLGNAHPRFWGWVVGSGSPIGMLAEMLAGGLGLQMGGGHSAGLHVELQVLDWFKQIMNFPDDASGVLVSGASMANLVGLTVARNTQAPFDIRKTGLQNGHARLMTYASTEVHSCHQKNSELLGLGSDSVHYIPVNDDYQMEIDALHQAIEEDIAKGYVPFCVVGTAGTVKTGAFDDFHAIADICEAYKLWFHVDGAFGAIVALSPELQPLIAGTERADSIAFDMHKWLSVPFEAACVLVKRGDDHYRAFNNTADYLTHSSRGPAGATTWLSDYGIQLSRNFRALKVWMSLKAHGTLQHGEVIHMNVEQARYFAQLVDVSPELEQTAPVPLNIVCFRYVREGLDNDALNALNTELLLRLQEGGVAIVSNSTINGKYSLRMANVNHRSTYADFDLLAETVIELGRDLIREESFG